MISTRTDFDVIVVGSRVAGSVVGSLLATAGRRVLVLDRASFPSDTLSTHFFRAPALRAFAQVGCYEDVQASAPHLTVNFNAIDGTIFPEPVDRPDDYPFYMCVRRIVLDEILVNRLERSGAELHQSARATGLLRDEGAVSGVTWRDDAGEHSATAQVVVGADGVRSFVAKQVGAVAEEDEPVNRAMYYAYFLDLPPNDGPAAEFHYLGNQLAYCFPCDDGLTLLASSVPIEQFKEFKRDPEGKLMAELRTMSALEERLRDAQLVGPVMGTGSIPGYLRVPYGDGWALVGDAGMVMDPWSGQGIDQGTTHALFLAARLDEFFAGKGDWGAAMKAYHRDRNEFSLKTYRRTCRHGRDLRPMTQAALEKRGLR